VDGRQPVIDRLPGTANGWVSAGHFTTGIMMAAGTGHALADWISTGTRPDGIATFDLP
jgi:D-amino-acid dehydrogenase